MKVLASDFDGTLYFGKETGIKEEDKEAIAKFQQAGNMFGICSGRPYFGMKQFLDGIYADFYIQDSGTHILDKDGNSIYERTINPETIELMVERNPGFVTIFFGDGVYINVDMGNSFFKNMDDLRSEGYKGIYAVSVQFKDEEMAHSFVSEVSRLEDLNVFQNKNSLDCCSKGCSKETGVKFMKEYLKVNDVACIGDSYNDIPMLLTSKFSFTFNTSPLEVQQSATFVVDSIAEAISILMRENN